MNKILILGNEPNILLSMEFLFKKEGFKVYIARDGEEAMAIIEENVPELVIVDITTPKVDGYEICQHLKRQYENVKVIFISAKNKQEEIEKGLAMGADLYVAKPFSTKDLVVKVKTLLN